MSDLTQRRLGILPRALLGLLLGVLVVPSAHAEKPTHNMDGDRKSRHAWRGTLTGSTAVTQLSRGEIKPRPQHCQDEVNCSFTHFYLTTLKKRKARTGTFTVWVALSPQVYRGAVAIYDAKGEERWFVEVTTKGSGENRVSRTIKLPHGFYQVIVYGVVSAGDFSAEARWVPDK